MPDDLEDDVADLGATAPVPPPTWWPDAPTNGALARQVGGAHYKAMPIQPVEFSQRNRLPFIEGNVVKYVCRHRHKHGAADIRKAIHYLELLLQIEYPEEAETR